MIVLIASKLISRDCGRSCLENVESHSMFMLDCPIRQTDRQNRLFDQKEIYKLHTIIIQIDDQENATKTKFVAIVTATF